MAVAVRELNRIECTLFILDWLIFLDHITILNFHR